MKSENNILNTLQTQPQKNKFLIEQSENYSIDADLFLLIF